MEENVSRSSRPAVAPYSSSAENGTQRSALIVRNSVHAPIKEHLHIADLKESRILTPCETTLHGFLARTTFVKHQAAGSITFVTCH